MALASIVSAKTKLVRAAKHLKAIQRCIATYSASHPYVITKAKGKGTRKLTIPKAPPREISVLVGEMLYQMRSALDHLAFDLVRRNPTGIPLPATWFKNCEFPLFINIPAKGNPPVPYITPVPQSVFAKKLPGISKPAFAFIESVQPYYRRAEIDCALAFLAELSNIDKHRYLNIVAGRVRESQTIRYASGLRSRGHHALDHGAKLPPETGRDQFDLPVYVHRRFRTFVAFKEREVLGDATALPVDYLLQFVLKQIQMIIVPTFEKLM